VERRWKTGGSEAAVVGVTAEVVKAYRVTFGPDFVGSFATARLYPTIELGHCGLAFAAGIQSMPSDRVGWIPQMSRCHLYFD
jgi:hypothetical protein